MILETNRLRLRPWRESDAASLFRYACDPAVGPIAGWPPHKDIEESRRILRDILCVPETYAVCLKETDEAIGSISLRSAAVTDMTERSDECELGYWLGKPHWGKGIIPEAGEAILRHAFCDLSMNTVWCGYYDGNSRSRRVQEKLGFVYHHTTHGLEVKQMNEIRTGHVSCLKKEDWLSK